MSVCIDLLIKTGAELNKGKYKTARCKIMQAMQDETANYSNMYTLHIDAITPEDHSYFNSKCKE